MTGADVPASAESTPGAPAAKSELQPASTWYQPTAERITGTLPADLECDFWQVTVQIQSSGLLDRCDLGYRFDQCVTDWVRTHLVEELTSDPEPTIGRITQSRLRTRPRIRDAMDTQIARWCRNALPDRIRGDLAGTDHLMESSWLLEQIGTARIYEACLVQWLQDGFPAAGVDLAGLGPHARSVIIDHVVEWCRENVAFGSGRPFVPNREQAAVIATTGQHALVAARAGSGKTATMVARTVFLIKGRGADPKSIMMLAFNKDAAKEIETRLASQLGPEQLPYVLTFHALAHRIVHPTGTLLADASDASGTGGELSWFVQKCIDELMDDPDWERRVRDVMLEYFKGDWERIKAFGQVSARQGLAERAGLARESIKGDFVKSYGEKAIANALYLNGFTGDSEHTNEWTYKYEADVFWNGANYKPDFMIFDPVDTSSGKRRKHVVIEYFGMVGDLEYDQISQKKRDYWAEWIEKNPSESVTFLGYLPENVADPGFEAALLHDLRAAGLPQPPKLGEDDMWERVGERAIDRFTSVVRQIISRARQRSWSSAQLKTELGQAPHGAVGPGAVTELAADVLGRYEAKLADSHSNDFPGLMWQAIGKVRSGETEFGGGAREVGSLAGLRHIVIDEFQDFSLMFDELIQAILAVAPGCTVMTVGDDWQAINEFAGSDTRYFHDFEKEFPGAQRLELVTNRRSAKAIVKAGNTLMSGRGTPAKPAADAGEGVIRTFDLDGFWPTADEQKLFDACDRLTPALLRLIAEHLAHGRTVAVLRRNGHGRFVHFGSGKAAAHQSVWGSFDEYGSKFLELLGVEDSDSVHFGTIHSFKGQEADAVILVDVDDHNHPFVHPTWQMLQVFGDTPEKLTDAERRLFYVGISRPREYLDVLTSASGASPFWKAFSATLAVLPDMPGALSPDDRVEILVSNALGPDLDGWRADLKSSGFTWRGAPDDCWSMTTDMDWRHLLDADSWAKQAGTQITVIQQDRVIHEHFVPDEASQ